MTATRALTFVYEVAYDVAVGDLSPEQALAEIRAHGGTPDREALADAVAALQLRDVFAGRQGNPYSYLDVEPRPGLDAYDAAVRRCEDDLSWSLRRLAVPAVSAVAS